MKPGQPQPTDRFELSELLFENRFTASLPADRDLTNVHRQVVDACYSRVRPQSVAGPQLVAYSKEVALSLGLREAACQTPEFAETFAGNRLLDGMDPHAMCYGGHQFGHWAGQLGDGRAINLGEVPDIHGKLQMLQLKGAGPTPYRRGADGLAVLRSSVREFLCSEAMFHLGVPTTRALSLVLTGEEVVRDMFYDGRPEAEPGAVVCRVAPSFLRFGSYEIWASLQRPDILKQLVDFTIKTEFAHLLNPGAEPDSEVYVTWFEEVCRRTAEMVVHWMRVGFVHGVMNTDNMSILGLTIDYGPYGWLENYDPDWTPNTTDAAGRRYRFGHQGQVAGWNLMRLASAIVPLVEAVEPLQSTLDGYGAMYERLWREMMADKLGLPTFDSEVDPSLFDDLFEAMQVAEIDMTIFFRRLAQIPITTVQEQVGDVEKTPSDPLAPLAESFYEPARFGGEARSVVENWFERYRQRVLASREPDSKRRACMESVNPEYVLRNYLAQLAIDKATTGDFSMVHDLLDVLRDPYVEQSDHQQYAAKRPEWARNRPGCSTLSCSS
ncbi:MAG: YdiU family protein [Planctomycetota bacterium]|nr:YdiU family protein [Planctomycetota bacterium]